MATPSEERTWSVAKRFGLALALVAGLLTTAAGAAAQTLWDDPAFALTRQAQEALERGDLPRAAELAREAIGQYPGHIVAHYLLAQVALADQKWDGAAAALREVLRLYPRSFAAHRELGVALAQLGRGSDAADAFETALRLRADSPDSAEAADIRLRLAFLRLQANDRDRALPLLADLARAGSTVPEVWVALGRIYFERDAIPESEGAFARAAALRDEGKTWFNLGVVRLRLYDKNGAIHAFDRASRHPETREQAARELEKLRAIERPADSKPAAAPAGQAPPRP